MGIFLSLRKGSIGGKRVIIKWCKIKGCQALQAKLYFLNKIREDHWSFRSICYYIWHIQHTIFCGRRRAQIIYCNLINKVSYAICWDMKMAGLYSFPLNCYLLWQGFYLHTLVNDFSNTGIFCFPYTINKNVLLKISEKKECITFIAGIVSVKSKFPDGIQPSTVVAL